ncbi:NEW3 domain-containing protein [Thermophagus sp. OGC60D27]|uniref:NEW3 domain-containing protein n=1 Tax=Thermophagus sp. OGC60D27 TaxID=3458415 RepID=UPI004037ADB7
MKKHVYSFKQGLLSFAFLIFFATALSAASNVQLYTPYTSISVPPGEKIEYSIDVKNNGDSTQKIDVYVSGLGKDWTYSLKAGGYAIKQLAVLPGEKKTLSLTVNVPVKVNKGNHWFSVVAKNHDLLKLVVNVSEQGTFKTEFTCDQANIEGHADANFTFQTKLKNSTAQKQVYSLLSKAPRGWKIIFKPNYKQATAVEVGPNETENISIQVEPPYNVEAGTYKIPVRAANRSTSAELELEVVISGSYEMELSTPTGRLSTTLTAGRKKDIELVVKNTGSSVLKEVRFSASKPKNWTVEFHPDTIPDIQPGEMVTALATIQSADKAIPGDYVSKITAKTPDTQANASFRMTVKTPLLWGWLGILIILITLGVIFYLFRKYGRR